MTEADLIAWHRPNVEALVRAGVDYLALETIPAEKEALALVKLLREFPGQKAWLSFSCKVSSPLEYSNEYEVYPQQLLQQRPPPRIINVHFAFRTLPQKLRTFKYYKTFLCCYVK